MNLHQCRVALRPRGPLEVFDLAFALARTHAGVFTWLTAIVVGPIALLGSIGVVLTDGHPAWLALPVVTAPFIGLPFTLLAGRVLFADQWTVRQVLGEFVRRLGSSLSVVAITVLLDVIGVLSCGVGWMLTRPATAFLAESALLERTALPRLLQRSVRLALLHPAGALAVVAAWFLVTGWGMVAGEAAGQALFTTVLQLGRPFGSAFEDQIVTPFVVGGGLIVQPFLALYRVLQFVDVRTRVDGWDLQVGLRAAGMSDQLTGGSAP